MATTDQSGYYQSSFAYIPANEMVTVWAAREGYAFSPDQYYWPHYMGYEVRPSDFIADLWTPTPTATARRPPRPHQYGRSPTVPPSG